MLDIIPSHLIEKQHIAALNSLRVHEGNFVDLLRKSRDHFYSQMVVEADTVKLHALRGQAGVMTHLITLIETSGEAAARQAAG